MKNTQLTLIIVSFNSAGIIERCQKELLVSNKFSVLLIDNASPDGSAAQLKKMLPLRQNSGQANVEIIELEQNIGYGRAANIGLRQVKTPYALLLNPDLKTSADQIEKLLDHALNDPDNTAIWGPSTHRSAAMDVPPQDVKWISGSAMLFDVEKVNDVGLFDENIFLFAEETDLCERTLATGYKIKLCRNVFFDHLLGQATPTTPAVEYMKSWHRGWRQCYRMTKNGHCTWARNPRRKLLVYRLHSIISTSRKKRMKWKAKADGAKGFLRGKKAFDEKGLPRMSDL